MKGAREYASLFKTGQYGKLYIVSGSHARGSTFRIHVLPENEKAIPNGENNDPLNSSAVEVYGAISGQNGWTEVYGWIHEGAWQNDFDQLFIKAKEKLQEDTKNHLDSLAIKKENEDKRINDLLSNY